MEKIRKIIPLLLLFCSFQYVCAQQKELDIIPKPVSVEMGNSYFAVTEQTLVTIGGRVPNQNAAYISERLKELTGYTLRTMLIDRTPEGSISFQVDNKMTSVPAQGYQLKVGSDGVRITAPDVEGVMNGAQTLFQIMTAKGSVKNRIPYVEITDYPRFGWRGMMLDVSRQFFDKEFVMRYIDWLAAHKMNIFHWHLTDDNGWRLEIKSYPDLTLKGAWRGPGEVLAPAYGSGNQRYGGYYTQDDIREVVAYAKARNVQIMPEIEIPGHSRAVVASYPHVECNTSDSTKSVQGEVRNVWCVGREENYRMLDKIIREITGLFPFEYIHIAGDEVNMSAWGSCPECQALMKKEGFTERIQLQNYFVRRVEKIIEKHGKKMGGFNEIMKGGELSPNTKIFAWQGINYGIESAKKGLNTIMMPAQYFYFDMAQTDTEHGHRWAAITDTRKVYLFNPAPDSLLNAEEQKRITGVHGGLWAEYLDRPARIAEYQSYPRISALSEIGWTPQKDRQWDDFYTRLTRSHLQRLADMGIAFRDFPPQAIYKNGIITVTIPYEGAVVRYDDKGKVPTLTSPEYSQPIPTNDYERYMFRTFFGGTAASPAVKAQKAAFAEWDFSNTSKSFTSNITKEIDKSGVWHLSLKPVSGNAKVTKVALSENGKVIREYADNRLLSQNPRYSFPIDAYNASHTYSISYTLEKTSDVPVKGTAVIECSMYQEPQINVSSSLTENQRFPLSNLSDWNLETYYRTNQPCKNGDWILFEFPQPVVTSRIDVSTGIPFQSRYGVTDGHVAYSYDGIQFIKGDEFDYGNASIIPSQGVKAVKIMITGINNEPLVAVQNLRIFR